MRILQLSLSSEYLSYALTHPRAMVIKTLNAIVAYRAMWTTGRAVKHASVTVFYPDRNIIDHNFFCPGKLYARCLSSPNLSWCRSIISELFFRWMWVTGNNTWIPGWCKKKKHQYLSNKLYNYNMQQKEIPDSKIVRLRHAGLTKPPGWHALFGIKQKLGTIYITINKKLQKRNKLIRH